MVQRFFKDSLQSRFIKALLYNTPLPTLQTVRKGDYVIANSSYIYKRKIITCDKSGYLEQDASYRILGEYTMNEYNPAYTYRYVSTDNFYDSETHEQLGKYLRVYRDQTNINLLPFYNCFSNRYTTGIRVRNGDVIQTKSTAYKCALIPIELNKKYTICLDCVSNVYIAPVFLNKGHFINFKLQDEDYDLTKMIGKREYNAIKQLSSTSFKQPYVYSLDLTLFDESDLRLFKHYQDYLYLIVQVPNILSSSLSVLEGDYSEVSVFKQFNLEYVDQLSQDLINELLLGNLFLMQFNDEQQTPYSPRLIEYLLQNVITQEDIFWKDTYNIQQYLNFPVTFSKMKGVWDNVIRSQLYLNSIKSDKTRKLDLNGYVDKDVENMCCQGKGF